MHAIVHDAPATPEMHARVLEILGEEPPVGLVVHLALARPEGGLRYVDVWESPEAFATFGTERLGPAVRQMLAEHGIPADAADGPDGPDHAPSAAYPVVSVLWGVTAGAAARPS